MDTTSSGGDGRAVALVNRIEFFRSFIEVSRLLVIFRVDNHPIVFNLPVKLTFIDLRK